MAGTAIMAGLAVVGPEILKALIPQIGPVIQGLIHGVQNVFGHNNGTGQQKFETVLAGTLAAINEMIKTGKIPTLPAGTQNPLAATLVEMMVQLMKTNGALPASAPAVPTIAGLGPAIPLGTNASAPFTLASGSRITFEVTVK